jgi:PAS domain-containing protein
MSSGKLDTDCYEGMLDALYGSLLEPDRFDEFASLLRAGTNSHLIAIQKDDASHRHCVSRHYSVAAPEVPPLPDLDDANTNQYLLRGSAKLREVGVLDPTGMFGKGELEQTAFYRQILASLDVHYSAGAVLEADGHELSVLTISRSRRQPPFDEKDIQLLRRLYPHLRNVCALQRQLRGMQSLVDAIDALPTAMFWLDRDGSVLRLNPCAEQLLASAGRALRLSHQRFRPRWGGDAKPLQQLIRKATFGTGGVFGECLLHDAHGNPWAIASLHPLQGSAPPATMLRPESNAVLFLKPLHPTEPAPAELLRHLYGFTRAEAKLAHALLQYGSLAACSMHLRKSHETLRSQLKGMFAKTGTHRQGDLLRHLHAACGA